MNDIEINVDRIVSEDGEIVHRGTFTISYFIKGKTTQEAANDIKNKILKYIKIPSKSKIYMNITDMPIITRKCNNCGEKIKNTQKDY